MTAAMCLGLMMAGKQVLRIWAARSIERVASAKRWLDPVSVGCGSLWMSLHILAEPILEFQLRKAPLPVDMWSRWPQLRRPAMTLAVSLMMASTAVGLR